MRVVAVSDVHLDTGGALGDPDVELGSTRVADAARAFEVACREPCDVLVFAGDLGEGPAPHPNTLVLAQRALEQSPAAHIVLVLGNHDHSAERHHVLDVLAAGLRRDGRVVSVCAEPTVIDCAGLQVGVLPWAPPQRLYDTSASKKDAHVRAADALADISRGLAADLDRARPSLLVCHWLLSGGALASGEDVLTATEPVLRCDELEAAGWGAVIAGHNHARGQCGERSWVIGSPIRSSFGEERLTPGYMTLDYQPDGLVDVAYVDVPDRPMLTFELNVPGVLAGEDPLGGDPSTLLDGAIVRVRGQCTEAEARELSAQGAAAEIREALMDAGAVKVIGPQLKVSRERRERSELTVQATPAAALEDWLSRQDGLAAPLATAAREHAAAIIGGTA